MEPGFAWLQAEIEALRREREEKVGPTLDGPSVKAGNKAATRATCIDAIYIDRYL